MRPNLGPYDERYFSDNLGDYDAIRSRSKRKDLFRYEACIVDTIQSDAVQKEIKRLKKKHEITDDRIVLMMNDVHYYLRDFNHEKWGEIEVYMSGGLFASTLGRNISLP